jgi:hypothetical protein
MHAASPALHVMEMQSAELSTNDLEALRAGGPPAQRLPGMVEAAILRNRDARGSRRCFARTARAKRAARTLICYPLSASPPFMQKVCWIALRGGNVSHRPIIDADFLLLSK